MERTRSSASVPPGRPVARTRDPVFDDAMNTDDPRRPSWAASIPDGAYWRILTLVTEELGKHGVAFDYRMPDGVFMLADPAGDPSAEGQLHLDNLSRALRDIPLEDWPAEVARFVESIVTVGVGVERYRLEWVDASPVLRARLSSDVPITEDDAFIIRPFANGLAIGLCLDLPTAILSVARAVTAEWPLDEDALVAMAIEQTRDMMRSAPRAQVDLGENVTITACFGPPGSEGFAATGALFLGDWVTDHKRGALFVVPRQGDLAVHEIRDGHRVMDALARMSMLAQAMYADGPRSLSPGVYWWHEGQTERVAIEVVTDGGVTGLGVGLPPALGEILRGLGVPVPEAPATRLN